MRVIVLAGGTSVSSAGWHVRDLARAAESDGHDLVVCSWKRLVAQLDTQGPIAHDGEIQLTDADAIIVRTMPPGSLEQIVFRMDLLLRLEETGVAILNRPRAIELAVDKYLALARMQQAGLPIAPTIVCQQTTDAAMAFAHLGGDVVIKPIFGSEGFGITRISDPALAERAFATLTRMNSVIYLQRFIEHGGVDIRLFVLGDRILTAMQRSGETFRTNIAQGGVGRQVKPDPALCSLALRAAKACGTSVAGVDIVVDIHGAPFVLEVNAVPGWRALSCATGVDVAAHVVRWLASHVAAQQGE